MPQAYSFPYHHILHRSLPINRHYLTSEEVNTRSSSTVQTDCFYPFPTLLALTDQFLQSYFNLIEPNSVFTAFGLMTPNSGTTEDDLFSALLFSSYDEVNTRIGRKPVSICFFFLCKSFGFFVLTREKKLLLEGWYIFWALNDRGALCFHVLADVSYWCFFHSLFEELSSTPGSGTRMGSTYFTGEGKGMMGIYLDPAEAEAEEVKKEGRARLVSKKVIIPLLATITSLNKERRGFLVIYI